MQTNPAVESVESVR